MKMDFFELMVIPETKKCKSKMQNLIIIHLFEHSCMEIGWIIIIIKST